MEQQQGHQEVTGEQVQHAHRDSGYRSSDGNSSGGDFGFRSTAPIKNAVVLSCCPVRIKVCPFKDTA
jgi:hypothetical protein